MTKKRFEYDKDTCCFLDHNEWGIKGKSIEEIEKLLNALHDENQQLKQQLQQQELEYATEHHHLAEENEQLSHDASVLICSNQEYRKENEQLLKENQELHRLNQEYINNLSDEKKETLSEMLNAILGDDGE